MSTRMETLEAQKATLVVYLKSKIDVEDWHGVADAAMDIREIEAKLDMLCELGMLEG